MPLKGSKILLGVTGSIAAYKAADLCSSLSKLGADVTVVLTKAAQQFIGAPTFRALSRNPVIVDLFDEPHDRRIAHIDLAQSADLVLVAPASADIIAKMASGIADDMLLTCLLATPATTPLMIAPAMNSVMLNHPATSQNLATLAERGAIIVPSAFGLLACQDVGKGKLADVDEIAAAVIRQLETVRDLTGKRLVVTAGATREPIDPVRFISNRSSGKMGFAIAEEAIARGAHVTVIAGATSAPAPARATVIRIETGADLLQECTRLADDYDLFIGAAAVADYTPESPSGTKLKKQRQGDAGILELRLREVPDIIAALGSRKRADQVVIGFAAETENIEAHAVDKLNRKRCDLIVANDVTDPQSGFDVNTNAVTLIWADGRSQILPVQSKRSVARAIIDAAVELMTPHEVF